MSLRGVPDEAIPLQRQEIASQSLAMTRSAERELYSVHDPYAMTTYSASQISAAKELFGFLSLSSPIIQKADVIIGFGHFDLNIPKQCGELYVQGYADRIIFTGGIGSGTADLGKPEAQAFSHELCRRYPEIPPDALILEDTSTNTGENVHFTMQKLEREYPDFTFGKAVQSAILVANAYRQRRVWLTCRKYLPSLLLYNSPPATTFKQELSLFANKELNLIQLLVGEIERLERYAVAGYILPEPLPDEVYHHYTRLKETLS